MTTLNQSARQLNVAIEKQGFSRDELQSIIAPVLIAIDDHGFVPVELSGDGSAYSKRATFCHP